MFLELTADQSASFIPNTPRRARGHRRPSLVSAPSTNQGGGKAAALARSGYSEAAQAKLIDGNFRRQPAELIADVPAASQAIELFRPPFRPNPINDRHHEGHMV